MTMMALFAHLSKETRLCVLLGNSTGQSGEIVNVCEESH
jgi:hypothetical protein